MPKNCYILFTVKNPRNNYLLKPGNEILGEENCGEVLGLLIDEKPTWVGHVNYVKAEMINALDAIYNTDILYQHEYYFVFRRTSGWW